MSEFRNQLKVEGVNARGFGIMPKMVVLDRKLSIEAKAIYAYFCSYAGAGTTAFPSVSKIISDLCIGRDRYYRHFNQLLELGYIKVEQGRHEGGKFKHNIYTLVPNPDPIEKIEKNESENKNKNEDEVEPSTYNEDSIEKVEKSTKSPSTYNEYSVNQQSVNHTTNSNNLLYNKQSLYNNHSFIQDKEGTKERIDSDKLYKKILEKKTNDILDRSQYKYVEEEYQKSIEYSVRSLLLIDNIEIHGITIPGSIVQKEIEKLSIDHLDRAIEKYEEAAKTTSIKNKNKYFMYCLYDSLLDKDISIKTDMIRDNL